MMLIFHLLGLTHQTNFTLLSSLRSTSSLRLWRKEEFLVYYEHFKPSLPLAEEGVIKRSDDWMSRYVAKHYLILIKFVKPNYKYICQHLI